MQMRRLAPFLLSTVFAVMPFAAHGELRITEIMYDPSGSDSKREWVEIYNEGPYLVDLSVVKFADSSAHLLNVPPKNGGVGTITIVPNAYVVLASDATTFHTMFPNLPQVIDTVMGLNNTGATIGLGSAKGPLARAVYDSSLGGNGTGESLQWRDGAWIHAAPTPGRENAKVSSVPAPVISAAQTPSKAAVKPSTTKVSKAPVQSADAQKSENDPMVVVNATATDMRQGEVAAAGALPVSAWWLAAAALALSTGAAVTMISRTKRNEWNIEES